MSLRDFANNNYYLDGLKNELARLNTSLVHICATYSEQQLNWSDKMDKWSILQHVEHIHLHNNSFIKKTFDSLKNLPKRPDIYEPNQPFRSSPTGSLYINSISADSQLKMRALPNFVPSHNLNRSSTLNNFKVSSDKMFKLIEESRLINLNNIRLTVPGCNVLFYLGDVLQIIVQHTKRHLKQINDLVVQPSFPA